MYRGAKIATAGGERMAMGVDDRAAANQTAAYPDEERRLPVWMVAGR